MTADRRAIKLNIDEAKFLEAIDREGDHEIGAGTLTADRAALRDRIVALYLLDKGAYADVVDAAIDLIRAAVLEEAARVADALEDALSDEWRKGLKCDSHLEGKSDGAGEVAAALRALKEAPCSSS